MIFPLAFAGKGSGNDICSRLNYMNLNHFKSVLVLVLAMFCANQTFAWGFWAHQRINRLAVFTLPPEMLPLYKQHIEYITEHAVDPDKRRYAMENEAENHYIDVDHYGEYPFPEVPRDWRDAVNKYSEDTLRAYGIVPWNIQRVYSKLVQAFRDKDLRRILKYSADMGHYVGDANVPLHTTENYNGQLTDQKGIHGLWEGRLPELFGEDYDFFVGQARYIPDVLDEAWKTVLESHSALDTVLLFERAITEKMDSDKKYSFENRNDRLTKVYSFEFSEKYHRSMKGMVERRMRSSISRVGSVWFSAWVDAGQPDLEELFDLEFEEEEQKFEKKFKIIDRESDAVGDIWNPFEKGMEDTPDMPDMPFKYGTLPEGIRLRSES